MKIFAPKLFSIKERFSKKQLINDIVAGVIVAIIALPLSIALAIASGVSPEKGLYTAIVAGFVISFLGGSNVNISGPTAAFATIVAGIVAQFGTGGLVIATIMAGILLVIMGIFKFGSLRWIVETDRGPVEFRIRNMNSDIKMLDGKRMLVRDSNDNRYEIPDINQLDKKSLHKLFPYT